MATQLVLKIQQNVEGKSKRPWFDLRKRFRMYDEGRNGRVGRAKLPMVFKHFRLDLSDFDVNQLMGLWAVGSLGDFDYNKFVSDLERDPRDLQKRVSVLNQNTRMSQLKHEEQQREHRAQYEQQQQQQQQQQFQQQQYEQQQQQQLQQQQQQYSAGPYSQGHQLPMNHSPEKPRGPSRKEMERSIAKVRDWQERSERAKTPLRNEMDDFSGDVERMSINDRSQKSSRRTSSRSSKRDTSSAKDRKSRPVSSSKASVRSSKSGVRRSGTRRRRQQRPKTATTDRFGNSFVAPGSGAVHVADGVQHTPYDKKSVTKGIKATRLSKNVTEPQIMTVTPKMEKPKRAKTRNQGYDIFSN